MFKRRLLRRIRRRILRLLSRRQDQLPSVKSYSMKDVKKATKEFTKILVNNADVTLYRAQFPDGIVATVKRPRRLEAQAGDVFYEEVCRLGRLHHRNVVKLRGFAAGEKRLFIYEHMENGSLRDCLIDPLRTPLDWRTRVKIAIDVAAALEYLCYRCSPPALHVTVNSSNVLLDADFVAKVSDVAFMSYDAEHTDKCSTSLEEYREQKLSKLMFQFGVFVLELVTGLSISCETELAEWIRGSRFVIPVDKIVDSDLGSGYDAKELHSLLSIARVCLQNELHSKISMSLVFRYMQQKLEIHQAGETLS